MLLKNLPTRFNRIHLRLALIIACVSLIISSLVSIFLLALVLGEFNEQDQIELDSQLLSYWAAWHYGGDQAIFDRAEAVMREQGGRLSLLILYAADQSIIWGVIPGGWEDFDLSDQKLDLLRPGDYATLRKDGKPFSLLVSGTEFDDGTRLLVGVSTENRIFLLNTYRKNSHWVIVVILVLSALVGYVATRRLLWPIIHLNREIDKIIITGDLSYRLEGRGTEDQLDALIDRYNRLLDRVESLINSFKETLDAVAHELRTPLTRLRGHAEIALRSGKHDDYENALALVVEQTDQASSLLSTLMNISEAEQGVLNLEKESCDLGELTLEVCDMYSVIAEEKSQHIEVNTPVPVIVQGDPVRIRQVLGNLVDNAVKYTPAGGCIVLNSFVEKQWGVIKISDNGLGVSPEERKKIFERLYRSDLSRSTRGLGLGLSMVQALVHAHGGSVAVGDSSLGGAEFVVRFPA